MAAAGNPILDRLEQLAAQWAVFADKPDARILCWLVDPDEHAMVDAFVAVEDDEHAGQTADLFVPLQATFAPGRYGAALLREFIEKAAALHAGLDDATTPAWRPPAAAPNAPEPLPLLQACQSFIDHYKLPGLLALVLTPAEIADQAAFRQWLESIARTGLPKLPKLRLVVLDDKKAPALTALVQAEPDRVVAVPADLDMPSARLEISENAGNLEMPGGQFRHRFVQMSNALGKQDLVAADQHAQAALNITTAQGWFALAVPIHLAMGASLAATGRIEDANGRYASAEASAASGESAGDPVCTKLRVQARMCRGSLLIHAAAWQLAASLFAETLPMAQATKEPGMIIDCYRLASFCLEQSKQYQPAWQQGVNGLAFARTVDKAALATTTVAYLGESLARLCKRSQFSGSWKRIEQELVNLLGPKWRPTAHLPRGAAT
jgi:hypothetical protein